MNLRVLHITSEYPPIQLGGLGTAVRGLATAAARMGQEHGVLLVESSGTWTPDDVRALTGADSPESGLPYGMGLPYGTGLPYGMGLPYGTGLPAASKPKRNPAHRHRGARASNPSRRRRTAITSSTDPGLAGDGLSFFHGTAAPGMTTRGIVWSDQVDAAVDAALRWRPHLLHVHSSWLWPTVSVMRNHADAPVVYTVHSLDVAEAEIGGEPASWRFHGPVQEQALRESDAIVAISDSEAALLGTYYPRECDRVNVIRHGISARHWPSAEAPVDRPHSSPVVLYAGRMDGRKGIGELLAAWPEILERCPEARLVVAGCDYSDDPTDLAARWLPAGLRDSVSVRFLGWKGPAELGPLYRAADILVVPSRYEPFGLVVLEGMLHGMAVVASDTGGPAEILDEGVTGRLFGPGEGRSLTSVLSQVLSDPAERARLGRNAARAARRDWRWRTAATRMAHVYRQALRAH